MHCSIAGFPGLDFEVHLFKLLAVHPVLRESRDERQGSINAFGAQQALNSSPGWVMRLVPIDGSREPAISVFLPYA